MDETSEGRRHEGVNLGSARNGAALDEAPRLSALFLGRQGLRPIWRFLLYAAAYYALAGFFVTVTAPALAAREQSLWSFLVIECERMLAAFLPALALGRWEHQRFGAYGLAPRAAFGRMFWTGAVWGLVAITLLLLTMRGIGVFSFGGVALAGLRIVKFAGFWAVLFLVVAAFEEFLFRGYSQFTLARSFGFWPAALLLSALFGSVHLGNKGEAWTGALGAAIIGLFWCFTLRRTGSLWFALGMHAAWNWGETFLYSVPNSGIVEPGHLLRSSFHGSRWLTGGSVGPEGSVLLFVLVALMWPVFDRAYPAKSRPAGT